MADTEEISGVVQVLNCQRPTFSAGKIACDGHDVSFSVPSFLKCGDSVVISGKWETHPKFGRQFKGKTATLALPTTPAGLQKWLAWRVPGIGPTIAERLVTEFGAQLPDLAASDPQAVAIAAKVPIELVNLFAKLWAAERGRVGALTFLASLGLSQKQCDALVAKFSGGVVQLVQSDPFQLITLADNFGWVTVDKLAKQVGITGVDPRRLRGALTALVREAADEGSTAVPVTTAVKLAADKLAVRDESLIAAVVASAVERGDLKRFGGGTDDSDYLATPFAHRVDVATWKALLAARDPNPHGDPDEARAREIAEQYRRIDGITFDDSQMEALVNAIRYRVSVTTGSAGSGKTSLTRAMVKYFTDGDINVRLAAPTGRAARRMKELTGRDAETIHRMLEYNGGTGVFAVDRLSPLTDCVIIVDESSMCDATLFFRVLDAMGPRTALVLVGDPNQLPPVGAGAPLRDILAHDLAPAARLERSHRQAGILKTNCTLILSGVVAETDVENEPARWMKNVQITTPAMLESGVRALYATYLPKWGYDPVKDTQFMSAQHKGPFGTIRANLLLQRLHQAKLGNVLPPLEPDAHEERPTLYVGDKVVNDKNSQELMVMNGEIGVVTAVRPLRDDARGLAMLDADEPANRGAHRDKPVADLVVDYGDREVVYPVGQGGGVSLAYCLSAHRMQGSQAKCAIFICPKSHGFSLTRNLLYTAVTRAQRTACVIGDSDGIRRAAEKMTADARQTPLAVFARVAACRPV